MKLSKVMISALFLGLPATGCVPPSLFYWGDYDAVLYQHYKHPEETAEFSASLAEIIQEGEEKGRRVPPGLYAEYGYALYQQGNYTAAVENFRKEKALWPESVVLMDKMIVMAERQASRTVSGPTVSGP